MADSNRSISPETSRPTAAVAAPQAGGGFLRGSTFGFIGRSGCGKGTQLKLLETFLRGEGYDVVCIGLGAFGRELAQKETLMARWIKTIIEQGKQYPSWFASSLITQAIFMSLKNAHQILLFDGSPRRLAEAEVLEEVMEALGRSPVRLIHLDISEETARKRLVSRGRADDTPSAIDVRLEWFTTEVLPVVAYYGSPTSIIFTPGKRVITINSEQSIEVVQEEIQRRIFES